MSATQDTNLKSLDPTAALTDTTHLKTMEGSERTPYESSGRMVPTAPTDTTHLKTMEGSERTPYESSADGTYGTN